MPYMREFFFFFLCRKLLQLQEIFHIKFVCTLYSSRVFMYTTFFTYIEKRICAVRIFFLALIQRVFDVKIKYTYIWN